MSKITYENKECIYENADIPDVNKVKSDDMNEIKAIVNQNVEVIGNETDTYSASSTYALGSLVIYGGLLYKCTTAITVGEAWNTSKWTQVSLTSLANDGDVYSTEEQIIGKWIDGKPLYRKSFYRASLIAGTSQTVQHGISNVDKIWLEPSSSIAMWQNGNSTSLPFINQDIYANSIFVYDIGPTYYTLKSAIDRSGLTGYITFNYTKTTD